MKHSNLAAIVVTFLSALVVASPLPGDQSTISARQSNRNTTISDLPGGYGGGLPPPRVIGNEPTGVAAAQALVKRRLPASMQDRFNFVLQDVQGADKFDAWKVSVQGQKITITSGTTSGLTRGLLEYLRTLGGDIWWSGDNFASNNLASKISDTQLAGSSWAEHRHFLNVMTYSYTMNWYDWSKWEYLLDWMALHGYNLPLAPGGQEYIIAEMLRDYGLAEDIILKYITGPAFHGWSRQGNIRGSWGGTTSQDWLNKQWDLQKKIVSRMVSLGMTPILPGWAGYLPQEMQSIIGGHPFKNAPAWMSFPASLSKNFAIDPSYDSWFDVEKKFIDKQIELYGGWTSSYYNIDLFTEMRPLQNDVQYLNTISTNVMTSLQKADPRAVWVLNGWFMVNDPKDWTPTAIEAFIGNLPINGSLVLDLASESMPQWSRSKNFYGRRWIWNTLINYGENDGLFGRLQKWCNDIIDAKNTGGNIVGQGLTMEGINNNEHLFELATDQAWSSRPINLQEWTISWVQRRYNLDKSQQSSAAAQAAQAAWVLIDNSVYNAPTDAVKCTTRSVFDVVPNIAGIANATGNYLATKITYNTNDLVAAMDKLLVAARAQPTLATTPAFRYDLVDVARQCFMNAGVNYYTAMIAAYNAGQNDGVQKNGQLIVQLLRDVDTLVATDPNFQLSTWVNDARAFGADDAAKNFLEFQARNQITIWGPIPTPVNPWALDRYAAKHWTGVLGDVYAATWELFFKFLLATPKASYKQSNWTTQMLKYEGDWDNQKLGSSHARPTGDAVQVITQLRQKYKDALAQRVY